MTAAKTALNEWVARRGFAPDALWEIGCRFDRHGRHGFVLVWPYQFADGTAATRMLALELPGGPDWRNEGPVQGAVMVLGESTEGRHRPRLRGRVGRPGGVDAGGPRRMSRSSPPGRRTG